MADAKLTALTAVSVPDLADLLYLVDVSDATDDAAGSSRSVLANRLLGLSGTLPGGRLTGTTGVSVTTSDVTAQGTLYYTPHVSDYVRLYDGTRVREYAFTEKSYALSALTSGKNYDIWLYDNSGTLTLEPLAWTSDTARATAIAWQTGLGWTKSGDATRLYLGTMRTTGTTTFEDSYGGASQSGGRRFLWNAYNAVPRQLAVKDTTDSWTYATATYRQANGASGNKVEYVCGLNLYPVKARVVAGIELGANAGASGIGVDSTSANSAILQCESAMNQGGGRFSSPSEYQGYPGLGYHYLAWLEYARAGSIQFDGDLGIIGLQSGMTAEVMA